MATEKIDLRHKGELATLRNFLGGYYYQTVWDDFGSDEEIWNDYALHTDQKTIYQLVKQIDTLLKRPVEARYRFLADAVGAAGGLYFENPQEAKAWLFRFRTDLLKVLSER